MGHVRDLPKRKLGLDVAHGYKPSYEVVPAKKETIGDLKRSRRAGRDWSTWPPTPTARAKRSPGTCSRRSICPTTASAASRFHEITERAVKDAFSQSGPINMDMVNAQQARRFLDRFVGYQLSPLLWKKVGAEPERGPRPVGRRPADRRPRARDPRLRHRGILEDRRDREPGRLDRRADQFKARSGRVRRRQVRGQDRGRGPRRPRRPRRRPVRRLQGRRDREARQGRRPVQDQHAPAAGGDPAAVLGQEDHEDRPGALRGHRRRRLRARRPDHLHANRQPARLRRGDDRRPRADQEPSSASATCPPSRSATPPARWPRRPTRPSGPPT